MQRNSAPDLLIKQSEEILQQSRNMNKKGQSLQALILADQALETFLRACCLRLGCTDETTLTVSKDKEKNFKTWGMTEYLKWLGEKKSLGKKEKSDFFTFHNWRNQAQHSGLIPSPTQVSEVIESIFAFFKRQRALWDEEIEYPLVSSIDDQLITEENDIHPIFRASPFLVQESLEFVRGEKQLTNDVLKRIDLYLVDKNGTPTFVEIEWNSIHTDQAFAYLQALKKTNSPFHLIWLIPSDLKANIPQGIEILTFKREQIKEIVRIRREGRLVIGKILEILSKPFTPPPSIMYQLEYQFPSVISACYFDAEVKTENRSVAIGLRKQSVGRYLDIVRSLCQSSYSVNIPELILLLIEETLNAPYYIEQRGGIGKVIMTGFFGDVYSKKSDSKYKMIAQSIISIRNLTREFVERNSPTISSFYGQSPSKSDLLYRVLSNLPFDSFELGDRIIIKKLIGYLQKEFSLTQTTPLSSIKHSLLNVDIKNTVSQSGYEVDMAKRLVEIAVLKRILLCISGVPIVRVLKEEYFREKQVINRVPCQHFRLEKNEKYVKQYLVGQS